MKGKRKDFSQFLQSQILTDVAIDASYGSLGSADGRFPAHRVILARNSLLFRSHFCRIDDQKDATKQPRHSPPNTISLSELIPSRKDGEEATQSVVLDPDSQLCSMFPQVLRYIYSGQTDIHEGNVLALLLCALKLQIPSLRAACMRFVKEQTNQHNLFALAATAGELGIPEAEGNNAVTKCIFTLKKINK